MNLSPNLDHFERLRLDLIDFKHTWLWLSWMHWIANTKIGWLDSWIL